MKRLILCGGIVLIISLILVKFNSSKNNVCKTFGDYYTNRDQNENCYYNPDGELTTPEVIKRWGYPVETHTVLTEDGYILTLFRIHFGKKHSVKESKQPVLLQHGYKSNSKCFVAIGKKSLGFILADNGYDVWLGNFRGSIYSRNHSRIKDTDEEFWNFSFHEMGVYDTAAQIDYINKLTNKKLIYIGFSMGTTVGTIYATTYPEISENKVKIFIHLAPFVFADGMVAPTRLLLNLWPYAAPIGQALTGGQFYPEPYSDINKAMWKFFCNPFPIQIFICTFIDLCMFGFDYEQADPETLTVAVLPLVDTVSIKTASHIAQFVILEKFQQFDYGRDGNLKKYGLIEPPLYDLSKVRVPMHLIRSDNDFVWNREVLFLFTRESKAIRDLRSKA
ncbi:hypothetical protein ILUMI_01569 [Ignelater luminosus]|uniref:Lipase n=1 Tax=Ignelater luminosus TaxID=2038154 RepID=A0A8K0DJF0_IGNLU|nr:hypothetical protein ILUMI_01569 [Ignelater luminosus]